MIDRDLSIQAQVALKAAVEFHRGTSATSATVVADAVEFFAFLTTTAPDKAPQAPPSPVIQPAPQPVPVPAPIQQASANVMAAFPGSTPVASGQFDLSTVNGRYDSLLAEPHMWEDLRPQYGSTMQGAKGPDFRHKTRVDTKGRNVAIWLHSPQYGKTAPTHILQALGEIPSPGPGGPQAGVASLPDPF